MTDTGRVAGKVALITGAARGQGRSHALRLAEEGADIIAVDLCADIESVPWPLSTAEELHETARLVEKTGRRVHIVVADVRDAQAMRQAVDDGAAALGRLDIVCANAGICTLPVPVEELDPAAWKDTLDVNLTGVFNTVQPAIRHLRATGAGSIILISSTGGAKGIANLGAYVAAKHGVVGLMRTLAIELGAYGIRSNAVLPSSTDTPMNCNDVIYRLMRPDLENPTKEDAAPALSELTLLGIPFLDPRDLSNAVLFLASDESRYVTGLSLSVDAGVIQK